MPRIKITGYINPDADEVDESSPTGLTEEAYMDLISNENSTGLLVADLENVDVEVVG